MTEQCHDQDASSRREKDRMAVACVYQKKRIVFLQRSE